MHKLKDQEALDRIAWWSDEAIRLPGGYRIGFDGLIGLVPGLGDAAGLGLSGYIILQAYRSGVPRKVILKMCINTLIDTIVGAVPFFGDIFDFYFKANTRNVNLYRQAMHDQTSPT